MKTTALASFATTALAAATAANGALIAHENFEYSGSGPKSGAFGFGVWNEPSTPMSIGAGLSHPGAMPAAGGAVVLSGTQNTLNLNNALAANQEAWMSWTFKIAEAGAATMYIEGSGSATRSSMGAGSNGQFTWTANGVSQIGAFNVPLGQTTLAVLHIDPNGATQDMTINLYGTDLGSPILTMTRTEPAFARSFIRAAVGGTGQNALDNIAIGDTRADVVVPSPGSGLLALGGMGALVAARRRSLCSKTSGPEWSRWL